MLAMGHRVLNSAPCSPCWYTKNAPGIKTVIIGTVRKHPLEMGEGVAKEIYWCIHTGTFYVMCTTVTLLSYLFSMLPLLGLFPSEMVHLLPVPNMERAVYPF